MELPQLKAFAAVAKTGGFAPAAEALNVTPSTITRAIAKLETTLGVRLFHRTTRSVSLTEAGQTFLTGIAPALDELDAAAEIARSGAANLSGALRVSASVSFGQNVIARHIAQFCKDHPNLSVDLILSDDRLDLISERIDIAVRHGKLEDSSLIAQRLCGVRYRLVASPDYLRQAPPIAHPKDIRHHACLTFPYTAFKTQWRFKKRGKPQDIAIAPIMRISNAAALAICVKNGMGLALLPDWMIDQDIETGALVPVLSDWTASGIERSAAGQDDAPALWMLTPSRQFTPAKTLVFRKFLKSITRH